MGLTLSISPQGRPVIEHDGTSSPEMAIGEAAERRIAASFQTSEAAGLVHLATVELQTPLPGSLAYAREFAREYLTRLCHTQGIDGGPIEPLAPPSRDELALMALRAPPEGVATPAIEQP